MTLKKMLRPYIGFPISNPIGEGKSPNLQPVTIFKVITDNMAGGRFISKLVQWIILALGAITLLYSLIYFAREGTKIVSYSESGTVRSEMVRADRTGEDRTTLIFWIVDSSDFALPVIPVVGDTIASINDSAAVVIDSTGEMVNRWGLYFFSPSDPGRMIPVEFQHHGVLHRTIMTTRLPKTETFLSILVLQIVRALICVSFVLVGLWAFLKRRESAGVRALAMFCYSMAVLYIFAVEALSQRYASFEIPFNLFFQNTIQYLLPFFGGFWLNLQLLFPHPKRFIREKPLLAYSLCYAPMGILMILSNFAGGLIDERMLNFLGTFVILPGQISGGFVILSYSHRHTKDSLEKRQTHLVLWGSGIGLASLLILVIISALFGDRFFTWKWQLLVLNLSFIAMLLAPLSFAYAFQRYRLLEVEGRLKRGTRYILVTAFLFAVFVGVIYVVGELMLRQLGITTRTPTLIASLAIAIVILPALRRIRGTVERRLYPERYRLRELSRDFLQQTIAIPDRETLWAKVSGQLKEILKLETVKPILWDDERAKYILYEEAKTTAPILSNGVFVRHLVKENKPICVDEVVAADDIIVSLEEELWMLKHNIYLIVPLVSKSDLLGFLGLSVKSGGEDYTPEEIQILKQFSSQLALASENIRLLEENIEKRRMQEELAMARRIQQGFLPRSIPDTPGLEIAAQSRFCLEVAGDYYDVISFQGKGTVLAVGDVSGKGAGAALLMANLQASLRIAAAIGIRTHLGEVVSRVNDLMYQNTSPEQYITFFAGYFKPEDGIFTYVNAGHNPPMIVRVDEPTRLLDKGGLLLGVFPNLEYEQGIVNLQKDDLMMMYTDGVSEAMNEAEEEFGEKRIEEFIRKNRHLPVDNILSGLEREVEKFCGNQPLMDDFTLMLVRVTKTF